jgi:uncharacterized membrane protein
MLDSILLRLLIGLIFSSLIGIVAYKRGSLSQSGVFGAILTGTTIFGFGGWIAGTLLIAFFMSSSLLSRFKETNAQKQRAAEMFDKGGRRDIWQALANGGAAALFATLAYIFSDVIWFGYIQDSPDLRWDRAELWRFSLVAIAGALATVNADTWATELGVLSRSKPRLITSLAPVPSGTSGGISSIGLLAAFAGALFISMLSCVLAFGIGTFFNQNFQAFFTPTLIGGFLGSLFDSFLGATVQAQYFSVKRNKLTERAIENDGMPNTFVRGWRWMTNDWVNFVSSLFGAVVAASGYMWIQG